MKCAFCKQGETQPGKTTVTLEHGESVVIIRDVPADICDVCGEYYLEGAVTERVLARAEEAERRGSVVEIVRFAA